VILVVLTSSDVESCWLLHNVELMGATPTIYARSRDRWRAYTSNSTVLSFGAFGRIRDWRSKEMERMEST
jgi:hypothetical protein